MQVRVNKYISESGYCSRREADKYIEQGHVTIDGKKAEVGSQVSPGQVVKVFGETISNKTQSVIIAYNKPVGVVSTTDPGERDNIVNAVGYTERIFPIGRLDKDSQGLILLTNDGDIVNKILRANNNHDKEYFVTVNKSINAEFVQRMQGGIPILGVVTRKCEVTQQGANSFTIVLRQGLNRQIRRMCEYLGYTVTKLQRTRIMHIHLGNLKMGQYRSLTEAESAMLYKKIEGSVGTASEKKQGAKKRSMPSIAKSPEGKSPTKSSAGKVRVKSVAGGRTTASGTSKGGSKTAKPSGRNDSFKPRGKGTKRSGRM
ncbi:23S rRNA pseudouridine(2604) synthase RluF [Bacteroides sp. 51]|uniref:23S rRNA pseudouridine(2604) synthase RluF n=1 Tax=Bacteroides sp. 51 TaxID=2302938 RepID=UPI0013D26BBA|nr:23S rRNA pseudouridine(2604) synthase RluF [Bacteroides sp. 51]NDV81409.1 23S rRNA pseudouridine(2604) synthase RluF [Bacteroides sp. 51]